MDLVEGWTSPIIVTLLVDGVATDLTGVTVGLVLEDKHGHAVPAPGTVSVVNPATAGKAQYLPTGVEFVAALSPYTARWTLTAGGKTGYIPNAEPDIWVVRPR